MNTIHSQTIQIKEDKSSFDWIQTARVFLMDAYQPPFAPELEFDAKVLAETMADMNANVVRLGTMGKYSTIQGVRFTVHPDQGERDLLNETIEACKPKNIKVIPYISTGHKLAWSMVTQDYPEYGQKVTPGGLPARSHMYAGEDHGTVCWMTPYREAFLDYVEHVVRDYDIDGIYFDAWRPHYFWPEKQVCYCDGCRNGFKKATGLEIPYHEKAGDYSPDELETIELYHEWYMEEYLEKVVKRVWEMVKSYKDIPLISNINNPEKMASLDPRIIHAMDAFLYERGRTILERAEGIGVPTSLGLHIWPYIGVYHNWPRLAFQGFNYQQQIFTNLMFGGGSIIAQPTGYLYNPEYREFVRYPFGIIKKYEDKLNGLKNVPYVGVVFAYNNPLQQIQTSWNEGETSARTSTLGAFSACLHGHVQVSSVSEFVLDKPELLSKYPVIYLANIPFISGERLKNIKKYVADGGCLIASYGTSLFHADGSRKTRFDLEDLFKVRPVIPEGNLMDIVQSYTTMVGGPNDLYLMAREENGFIFENMEPGKLYPLWYYEPTEVLAGGEVVMDIVTGHDQRRILPGIVRSTYGKGQVIYNSSALESLYLANRANILQELILHLVASVSPVSPPYELDAPASMIANLTASGDRLVFHLTNWTGNKFEQPWSNEYYLAPVENVKLKIRIPEGKKVNQVSSVAETRFMKKIAGDHLEVSFPKIEAYQAVIVELE